MIFQQQLLRQRGGAEALRCATPAQESFNLLRQQNQFLMQLIEDMLRCARCDLREKITDPDHISFSPDKIFLTLFLFDIKVNIICI